MQQIRFVTLLKHDPIYKKWLAKPPTLTGHVAFDPWRLFIQRNEDGGWAYRDFTHYADAYRTLAKLLPEVNDVALNCKRQAFRPPVLKVGGKKTYWPRPEYHEWCPFCRRPVILKKLKRHPLHPKIKWSEPKWMCGICGALAEFIRSEVGDCRSTLSWPIS